jgi:DNA-binding IclR family transcriptional regulator
VTLPLTQVDVAELSGASRPTTNRYLRRLEEEGLVRLNRGHVTVLDVEALRAVSAR